MENKIREEHGADAIIDAKEKAIIDLYAQQNCINIEKAELIYRSSQLKNIIRDKESTLYLESAYYILERYSEYMALTEKGVYYDTMSENPIMKYPYIGEHDLVPNTATSDSASTVSTLQHILFEQVAVHAAHHFQQLEQYRLLKEENIRWKNNGIWTIMFVGSPDLKKPSLASCFAERYRELGIFSKGKVVEVDERGAIGQCLGNAVHSINMNNLWIIEDGRSNIMDRILIDNQVIKNKLTRVTEFNKINLNEMLAIYGSYCNEEDDEEASEEKTDMKSVIEVL